MKKYEFRGKSVKTGEWVYGYLIEGEDGKLYIGKNNIQITEVDPKTVGLFIGFGDTCNKNIYEGDIVLYKRKRYFNVVFKEGSFLFMGGDGSYYHADKFLSETIEVVDNIFDCNLIQTTTGKLVAELFEQYKTLNNN